MAVSPVARGGSALAIGVLVATIGLVVSVAFLALTAPASAPAETHDLGRQALLAVIGATGSIGAFLIWRAPGNRVAWILAAIAILLGFSGFIEFYLAHALYGTSSLPLWVPVPLLGQVAWPLFLLLLAIYLPLFFPNGRLLSTRWRGLAWAALAAALSIGATGLVDPGAISMGDRAVTNPIGVPGAASLVGVVSAVAAIVFLVCLVGAVVSLVLRYRRGSSEERHQLKWFITGFIVLALSLGSSFVTSSNSVITGIAFAVAGTALPLSIAVAVLKYRLYDIDVVVSRTLVYGALAAFITAVYVGIVVGIGSLVGSGGRPNIALSIVATAIVAVAFQPVRERLQKVANRLVYGKRATPYEVLSQFSERVAESYAADDVLPRMARVLADGTGAARADVWLRAGEVLRQAASWPLDSAAAEPARVVGESLPEMLDTDRAVEVRHQGELLGALTITKRKGESLTPVEEKLLDDLASQAGLVLKNVGLTAELLQRLEDLRASRQRLVAAQDEERRRLERNLHDGAQQNLVALKVKLGLAEAFAEKDPARAKQLVGELKSDADDALETLRDLARGIYPPMLADKGLAAALESQARKATIPVEIDADSVDRYPQETEAAVYFCVLEALQNVQKYAHATRASVRLSQEGGALSFEVEDDGDGFDPETVKRGAGLTNMADRLDALGGKLEVAASAGSGTRLLGSIGLASTAVVAS
jgi:signal transduction histidine kinase